MLVCCAVARVDPPCDRPDLHAGGGHHAAGAVLSAVPPHHLLLLDAHSDLLHHLQLLRVGKVPSCRTVAQNIRPDIHTCPVHQPLLHVCKHLRGHPLERHELGVLGSVLAHHLVPEAAGQLSQGLQMFHVDNQKSKVVI